MKDEEESEGRHAGEERFRRGGGPRNLGGTTCSATRLLMIRSFGAEFFQDNWHRKHPPGLVRIPVRVYDQPRSTVASLVSSAEAI